MVYTMMVGGGVAAKVLRVARKLGRLLKAIEVSTCANWELCFLPTFSTLLSLYSLHSHECDLVCTLPNIDFCQ